MRVEIPEHITDKVEVFDWLVENKELHYKAKKEEVKTSDAIAVKVVGSETKAYAGKQLVQKAKTIDPETVDSLQVESVINTTLLMDSHDDVHINGIWKKTLRENKGFYFLQEHKMQFDKVIADPEQVKASAQLLAWSKLGFRKFKGETEALIFNSLVEKARNPFMFEQIAKGYVKNHSVGMRYVNLFLAINSDSLEHKEQKEVWDKYADMVVNIKDAEAQGFFWAVTEAKVIEGSAVVRGSNIVTPTLSVESKDIEAGDSSTSKTGAAASTPKNRR